ncbi:MAG: XTP/dITP diphosphatase [Deltaproteobacteria bacterium]|nr:XTP/dITP diphosphatase [Deltaproteobacteria bacterium]
MRIALATKNRGKIEEIRSILKDTGIEVVTLDEFPSLRLPPEEGKTFKENALLKARHVARETGFAALADDSGLEVDYLSGRPGVYSARYAGINAADEENCAKLLGELEGVPDDKRSARFRCVIALVDKGREETFEGALEGFIAHEPKGENGFGYDPVFYIPGLKKTAAELPGDEKNSISHRGKALRKLKDRLAKKS